ncbi:hypothetical protein PybrP1_004777 [[Pythium] brassicae (nom. inval.)]|nr:hypothetical protein PybrP1_004777 [[Pythium] brassicae (nom. inval.)]
MGPFFPHCAVISRLYALLPYSPLQQPHTRTTQREQRLDQSRRPHRVPKRADRHCGPPRCLKLLSILEVLRDDLATRQVRIPLLAKDQSVGVAEVPGRVVRRAADHYAVDVGLVQQLLGILDARDAAVQREAQLWKVGLEPIHDIVLERRHRPVLVRTQAFQDALARVYDEVLDAAACNCRNELVELLVAVVVVHADAALDCDLRGARVRLDTAHHAVADVAHALRVEHEPRAKAAARHERARAAGVQVDLAEAAVLVCQLRGRCSATQHTPGLPQRNDAD